MHLNFKGLRGSSSMILLSE